MGIQVTTGDIEHTNSKLGQSWDHGDSLVIGIDAINIIRGGGVTHLLEFLSASNPNVHHFKKIIIWGSEALFEEVDDAPWIVKINPFHDTRKDGSLSRAYWQKMNLSGAARMAGCDILLILGGSYAGDFHPVVVMNRNMLPFEWGELLRYGLSFMTARLTMLRWIQTQSYRNADGVIFLSNYAKSVVVQSVGALLCPTRVIYHGVSQRFSKKPRKQKPIIHYDKNTPFNIIYVSIIDEYKHQWNIVEAVGALRDETGWPLCLHLVGSAYPPSLRRLNNSIDKHDKTKSWVNYHGPVSYNQLSELYHDSQLGIFASSCETFGQILVETMSAGLPIACSNRSALPEILGDSGLYFDPEDLASITNQLRTLIESPQLRARLSLESYKRAESFTWSACSENTFEFINDCYHEYFKRQSQIKLI